MLLTFESIVPLFPLKLLKKRKRARDKKRAQRLLVATSNDPNKKEKAKAQSKKHRDKYEKKVKRANHMRRES